MPASRGNGLSLVVSRNKSVGLPFGFPTQQLSAKVEDVTEVCAVLLRKMPGPPSVTALPKVQTALEGSREVGEDDQEVHFLLHPREKSSPGAIT